MTREELINSITWLTPDGNYKVILAAAMVGQPNEYTDEELQKIYDFGKKMTKSDEDLKNLIIFFKFPKFETWAVQQESWGDLKFLGNLDSLIKKAEEWRHVDITKD